MQVAERIVTLCGETHLAGLPCALVRFVGCDLSCSWCDTPHARTGGDEVSVEAIEAWVASTGLGLVLLTGGEPLLQRDLPLLATRLSRRHTVLVETSGAHDIRPLGPPVVRSIDVKCPGSGQAHRTLWDNLAELRAGDAVKMVLTGREDYDYALRVIRRHGLGPPVNILLSCSYPHLEPELLARWMIRDRLGGARLNLQLHRLAWANLESPSPRAPGAARDEDDR